MGLKVWLPLNGNLDNQGLTILPNTSANTFTYSNGKIGQCATGRAAWHLTEEILDNTWSVAMWVNPATLGSYNNILFCKNNTGSDDCHIYFSIVSTTQLNLGVNGPSSSLAATGLTFNTGTWYHVAATYDGTVATLYLNGQEVKHSNVTTAKPTGRLNMNINGRSTNAGNTSTTGNITCSFNDFRLYDHCLSAAEVREISQGLVLHYKLDDIYAESTINYTPSPYKDSYTAANPAWDASKHPNAIVPNNWGTGYNGGVSEPTQGYHAMWNIIENIPTIVFQNHNSTIGKTNRWLGVSSPTISTSIAAGVKYTISYEQRTIDTLGGYTTSGIYYKYNSSASNNFHDSCPKIGQNTILNTWQRFSYTFTRNANVDGTGTNGTIYIYGHNGTESTMQVRNIQLEIKDHMTGYTVSSRTSTTIQDSSGYNHNGWNGNATIVSSLGRYSTALFCNGTTVDSSSNTLTGAQYFFGNLPLPASSALTVAWWGKNDAYGRGGIFETTSTIFTESTGMNGTDYNTTAISNWDTSFRIFNGSSGVNIFSSFKKDGTWHHHAIVFDAIKVYYYCDGILITSSALTGTLPAFNGIRMGLGRAGGVYRQIKETISDFRIYCTALDADAIRQLYEVGAKVDNKQNLHAFELVEANSKIQITKWGQVKCNELEEDEKTKFYQANQIIETNEIIET